MVRPNAGGANVGPSKENGQVMLKCPNPWQLSGRMFLFLNFISFIFIEWKILWILQCFTIFKRFIHMISYNLIITPFPPQLYFPFSQEGKKKAKAFLQTRGEQTWWGEGRGICSPGKALWGPARFHSLGIKTKNGLGKAQWSREKALIRLHGCRKCSEVSQSHWEVTFSSAGW